MKRSIFKFKEFQVDQTQCNMKINTDSVLMGALSCNSQLKNFSQLSMLDIGTGSGVIALMLAQRFHDANITAMEIDEMAISLARQNFDNSPFSTRLELYPNSFQNYSNQSSTLFDYIVSNPPYFLNSLPNPDQRKKDSRHTNPGFFLELLSFTDKHLKENGVLQLIVPIEIIHLYEKSEYFIQHFRFIDIKRFYSFQSDAVPFRYLLSVSRIHEHPDIIPSTEPFILYESIGVHSKQYNEALKPFLLKL